MRATFIALIDLTDLLHANMGKKIARSETERSHINSKLGRGFSTVELAKAFDRDHHAIKFFVH